MSEMMFRDKISDAAEVDGDGEDGDNADEERGGGNEEGDIDATEEASVFEVEGQEEEDGQIVTH